MVDTSTNVGTVGLDVALVASEMATAAPFLWIRPNRILPAASPTSPVRNGRLAVFHAQKAVELDQDNDFVVWAQPHMDSNSEEEITENERSLQSHGAKEDAAAAMATAAAAMAAVVAPAGAFRAAHAGGADPGQENDRAGGDRDLGSGSHFVLVR